MDFETSKIDPRTKDEINKEGFEGNAALIIGKRDNPRQEGAKLGESGNEELDVLEQKLESEGRAADLRTYIKLNKKIIVPAKKLGEYLNKGKILTDRIGCCSYNVMVGEHGDRAHIDYIDGEGNAVTVDIDSFEKVAELKSIFSEKERIQHGHMYRSYVQAKFKEMIKSLGLRWIESGSVHDQLFIIAAERYKLELEQESEEAVRKEFDL